MNGMMSKGSQPHPAPCPPLPPRMGGTQASHSPAGSPAGPTPQGCGGFCLQEWVCSALTSVQGPTSSLLGLTDHPSRALRESAQFPPTQRMQGMPGQEKWAKVGSFLAEAVLWGGARGSLGRPLPLPSRCSAWSKLWTETTQRRALHIILGVREFPKKEHGEEGFYLSLLSHLGALQVGEDPGPEL